MNRPISVITLQETHLDSSTDTILFNLSDYTLISDPARINSFGGLAVWQLMCTILSPLKEYQLKSLIKIPQSMKACS